jgi:phosphoglycolate phosphatase-like HAD superfamily hydrolase
VCSLFPGVGDALELLAASFEVAVATNKRAGATLQILQAFKLAPFFGDRVFCAGDPGAITKGQALAYLKRARTAIFCAMVGDTQHDWQAAQEGSFEQFYAACWGARRAFGPSPGEGPDAELRVSASGPVIGFTNVQSFDQLAELALSAVDLRMVRHTTGA